MPAVGRCPLLGLKDDEHTNFSYLSSFHVCYRTGKAKPVAIEHQREFCLVKEHTRCPIFLYGSMNPAARNKLKAENKIAVTSIPEAVLDSVQATPKKISRTYWDLLGVFLFAIIFFIGWWAYQNRDQIMRPDPAVQASVYMGTQVKQTPEATEIFFADADLVRELTANPIPVNGESLTGTGGEAFAQTPSPSPTRKVCVMPDGWLVYVTRPGDTLDRLALNSNLSVDQLRLANCLNDESLVVGQSLYLPDYPETATPTITFTTTGTPTRTATFLFLQATYTATRTATRTPTPVPTQAATRTPTRTSTRTPTNVPATATLTATVQPTLTFTMTIGPTFTATPSPTNTFTPIPIYTDTPVPTPIYTDTPVSTESLINTP